MSGTFNEIDVPPTLVSFAVDVASSKTMITPELKKAGNKLVLLQIEKDAYDLPDYEQIMDRYEQVLRGCKGWKDCFCLCSGWSRYWQRLSARWPLATSMGVKIEHNVDPRDLLCTQALAISYARFRRTRWESLSITYTVIGEVTGRAGTSSTADTKITMDEASRPGEDLWRRYSRPAPVQKQTEEELQDQRILLHRMADTEHLCMQTQGGTTDSIYSGVPGYQLRVRQYQGL